MPYILKTTTRNGPTQVITKNGLPTCVCCDSFLGLGGQIQYLVNLTDLLEENDIETNNINLISGREGN
jgi:hypothetical protein